MTDEEFAGLTRGQIIEHLLQRAPIYAETAHIGPESWQRRHVRAYGRNMTIHRDLPDGEWTLIKDEPTE